MVDLPEVRDGDLAFSWNVMNIVEVLEGRRDLAVRLTRHSSATDPTLKLANRNASGPILTIVDTDLVTPVMIADRTGWRSMPMNGFVDWKYQAVAPAAPGVSTQTIRMYARAGQLYFKVEGSPEQQIPIGDPPGPSLRYAFWMG